MYIYYIILYICIKAKKQTNCLYHFLGLVFKELSSAGWMDVNLLLGL